MKKRELIEKIAEVGCGDLACPECPLSREGWECTVPQDCSVKLYAKDYLIAHPKKDKHCPHCGGSGEELTTVTTPGGTFTAFTKRPCPLCRGSKKRIKRSDLEAEVVRLRAGK